MVDEYRDALSTAEVIERAIREQAADMNPKWTDLGVPVVDRRRYAIFRSPYGKRA